MKSRFGFVLALIAVAAVVGFAVLSSNSAASVQSSGQQSVSAVCFSGQPAAQVTEDSNSCDPNEGEKKSDPNCSKE
jgi:cytochrome oxidase Cu insertion factor (SCO1/SenC/PrrC family)